MRSHHTAELCGILRDQNTTQLSKVRKSCDCIAKIGFSRFWGVEIFKTDYVFWSDFKVSVSVPKNVLKTVPVLGKCERVFGFSLKGEGIFGDDVTKQQEVLLA